MQLFFPLEFSPLYGGLAPGVTAEAPIGSGFVEPLLLNSKMPTFKAGGVTSPGKVTGGSTPLQLQLPHEFMTQLQHTQKCAVPDGRFTNRLKAVIEKARSHVTLELQGLNKHRSAAQISWNWFRWCQHHQHQH